MSRINAEWHERHVMPERATLEQRIEWHRAHQAACACRPIPAKLQALIQAGVIQAGVIQAGVIQAGVIQAGVIQASVTQEGMMQEGSKKKSARLLTEEGDVASGAVAETRFSNIAMAFSDQPAVSYGGKGFGSSALKFGGKIFTMLTSKGQFVIKVSRERAAQLVEDNEGSYFDPGHGRLMKDWVVVPASSTRWLELAKEAYATAAGRPQRISRPPAPARSAESRVAKARAEKARGAKLRAARARASQASGQRPAAKARTKSRVSSKPPARKKGRSRAQ